MCTSCLEGALVNNTCVPCPAGCGICDIPDACLSCYGGFGLLADGTCQACKGERCVACDGDAAVWTSCESGGVDKKSGKCVDCQVGGGAGISLAVLLALLPMPCFPAYLPAYLPACLPTCASPAAAPGPGINASPHCPTVSRALPASNISRPACCDVRRPRRRSSTASPATATPPPATPARPAFR